MTASVKAVGGLDRMTRPTQVNCRKHRQMLNEPKTLTGSDQKGVQSGALSSVCRRTDEYDCRCSRQGLNHPRGSSGTW